MRVTAVMDMFFVFWNAEVRDTSLSSESTKTNDKQWSFAAQCRFSEVCLKFRASEQFFTNLALSDNLPCLPIILLSKIPTNDKGAFTAFFTFFAICWGTTFVSLVWMTIKNKENQHWAIFEYLSYSYFYYFCSTSPHLRHLRLLERRRSPLVFYTLCQNALREPCSSIAIARIT